MHTAYTLDGSPIFHAETWQEMADAATRHTQENRKPAIGYSHNPDGGHYPFTVWKAGAHPVAAIGNPCHDFDEVCAAWERTK